MNTKLFYLLVFTSLLLAQPNFTAQEKISKKTVQGPEATEQEKKYIIESFHITAPHQYQQLHYSDLLLVVS